MWVMCGKFKLDCFNLQQFDLLFSFTFLLLYLAAEMFFSTVLHLQRIADFPPPLVLLLSFFIRQCYSLILSPLSRTLLRRAKVLTSFFSP